MLATSDFRDGNAVIGKVRRCLIPETSVNSQGKLVLHPLRNVKPLKPVQFIVEQPCQTSIVLAGARVQRSDVLRHSIVNQYPLQLISDRLRRRGQN